jgi:hypothetical protein
MEQHDLECLVLVIGALGVPIDSIELVSQGRNRANVCLRSAKPLRSSLGWTRGGTGLWRPVFGQEMTSVAKGYPMIGTILLIILILLLVGALPSWPYSSGWGYYPSGGFGLLLIILLILLITGRV